MTSELKPCPFCGEPEYISEFEIGHGVYCDRCLSQAASVEAWNRRAPSPAVAQLIDVSKRGVEDCDGMYYFELKKSIAAVDKEMQS
jgi:hypothetical protein